MIGSPSRRSTKHIVVMLVAALFASALYVSNSPQAAAEPILGGQLYSTGGVIEIEVMQATAGLTSELFLFEPGPEQFIATNRDVGTVVEIGPFLPGVELVFGIRVGGNEFRLGPGDRNPDDLIHGEVDFIEPGVAIVGFEDLLGGGDLDYDDNVFRFSGRLAPEPPRDIPDPIPPPVVNAGPDQTAVEGDVVSLVATEPAGPGVGAQTLVGSVDRRTFPNDPDTSVEVALNGLADGVIDGSVNLQSFGGESFNLINVIDVSGSTEFNVDGCGGDENGDGRDASILDCEILAITTLNDRLAAGTDVQTALVAFARRAVTADVDPADGVQAFTTPTSDADGNGIFDLEQVVRSVDVERVRQFTSLTTGGGTNFGEAVERACEVAANGQADRTVVAFMSDGEPFASRGIDLPCGDVVFRTFAVGGGAACEGRGRPSLQSIADLSGGSCVEIADVSELPEVFALTIAPQVVAARLIVDGGAPVDVSDSLGVDLPASGALTLVADTADLLDGATEVCLEVDVRDSVGVTAVSTCSTLRQSDGTYTYQWRTVEQTGPPVLLVGATTATPSFVAFDDGRYVFEVMATDNVGQTVTDTVVVEVGNAEPVVTVSSFDPSVGGVALLSGEFVDAGWDDVHSVRVSWGDGTVSDGVVGVQSSGRGTIFATHVYDTPGAYDVSVTVTDDDGGAGAEALVAPPQVTSPAAVWADAAADPLGATALTFSGSNVAVDGLVHSNTSIGVETCTNSFGGTVRYVAELIVEDFCGDPTDALALPVVTTVTEPPLVLDFADFAPAGGVPGVVPGSYFDKTDRCRDGQWRVHDQDLAPGIYYVDCDVDFSNASGEVTIVATGEIRTSGDALDFRPFFGSLLFLSGAVDGPAVTVSSTNSGYAGAVYGIDGAVLLDGEDNAYVCGIYGNTVTLAGDRTAITGADCGDRPAGSIAAVLQPDFGLTLTTSADLLTPGDSAPFELTYTNSGATFVVPGVAGLQNIDAESVTVNDLAVTIETRTAGSDAWAPAAGIGDVEVVVAPTDTPGVVNAAGVAGTAIEPNAIAVWGFQAIADLTPAMIAVLTDPAVTTGIRLRVSFDTTADLRIRPLYEIGDDFAPSVHAQTGSIAGIDATFLTSNGLTRPVALGDLAPGATSTEALDLPIAVPPAIRPGEPSTAYINRLRAIDGAEVVGAVFAVGASDGQRVIAPVAVDNAIVQLPIVDTQKSGPADITSGDLVPWSIRLVNVGSVPATAVGVIDTFGDQSLPVEGVATEVAPGEVIAATTSTVIPADVVREFTENRADTTWQDANGNTYGPTFGISPLDIYSGPSLRAILVDELAGDPDGNSLISPGDAIRYTTTITNSGDRPLTGVVVSAPIDPNTSFDAASVLGGTLISDPAADTIEIEIGELAGVSQTTVSWAVTVADPFPAGASTITSNATVGSNELPPVPASDPEGTASGSATETAIVVPFPVLEFSLSGQLDIDADNSGFVTPGDTLSYSGEVVNVGNAPADAAVATITLGDGLSLVSGSATADSGAVTETAGGLSVDMGTLGPNQPVQLAFDAVIDPTVATGQTDVSVSGEVVAAGLAAVLSDDPNTDTANDGTSIGLGSTGVPVPGAGGGPGSAPPLAPMPAVSTGAALAIDDSPVNPGTGATCSSITPTSGTTVTETTSIAATVEPAAGTAIASWAVLTYPAGEPGARVDLATGTGVPPAQLADFDPSEYANGTQIIVVEVRNDAGEIGRCLTEVLLEGQLALGRFATGFLDLDATIGSTPLRIVRAYDTQRRNIVGDFGHGWDLNVTNFKVQTNTELGRGPWDGQNCGGFLLFTTTCYSSAEPRYVTVTWPDGRVETFDLTFEAVSLLSFFGVTPEFEPRDGTTSTLSPAPGDGSPALGGDGNLNNGLFVTNEVYNPQRFLLTDSSGVEYLLDKSTGLVSQTDRAGNVITVDTDGIRSSLGPEIRFVRDDLGRIVTITDLAGGEITYAYDAAGDLVSVTDQNGNTSTFGYLTGHYLSEIDDPGAGPAQTLTYDADGNLTGITDANGNTTTVSVNADDRTEITTSPDGGLTTVTTYDERGNVVSIDEIYDGASHVTTFTYNNSSQLTSRTDPLGNSHTITYDANGNPTVFTDSLGNATTFSYDANDQPIAVTFADGSTKDVTYDDRGLPLSIQDADGNRAAVWDGSGNLLTLTDAAGQVQRWTYDQNSRLESETDAAGRTVSYGYDAAGNLTTITYPENRVQTRTYDSVGNLTSASDDDGHTATYTYDAADRLEAHTDGFGASTTYTRNGFGDLVGIEYAGIGSISRTYENGLVTEETDVAGGTTRYTYTGNGLVATVTDADGVVTAYDYDAAGRRVGTSRTVAGQTATTTTTYDALGQVIATTDALGNRTTNSYDRLGRLTAVTDALGRTTSYGYNAAGNPTMTTNAAGETTTTAYDAAGRPISVTDPAGGVTTFTYDAAGNISTSTDPVGRTTTFGYDAMGRQTSSTLPSGATISQAYDGKGRLIGVTDPLGATLTQSWDADGRLQSITDPLGNSRSFGYDSRGRLGSETDGRGNTTSYTYDPFGQLTAISDPLGGVVALTYDAAGRRTSVTDPNGAVRRQTYDPLGQLIGDTDALGRTTSYEYDLAGQLVAWSDPRGVRIERTYDAVGQVLSEASPTSQRTFTWDNAGRLASMTNETGTTSYTYDLAGRPVSVSSPQGTIGYEYNAAGDRVAMTTPTGRTVYGYDPDGNLATVVDPAGFTTTSTYDAAGRISLVERSNQTSTTYGYDAAGNTVSIVHDGPTGASRFDYTVDANRNRTSATDRTGTTTYALDANNRLTGATYPDGTTESFGYDAAGNRISALDRSGVTTQFVVDAGGQITSSSDGVTYDWDATGNLVGTSGGDSYSYDDFGRLSEASVGGVAETYGYDASGQRVLVDGQVELWDHGMAVPELVSSGGQTFTHTPSGIVSGGGSVLLGDALGSARIEADAAGAFTPFDYDAFGEPTGAAHDTFGFAGGRLDDTGLLHLMARQYDPGSGRFLATDPIQPGGPGTGGWNLYSYAGNNPTTWTDPTGEVVAITYLQLQLIAAAAVAALLLSYYYVAILPCLQGTSLCPSFPDIDIDLPNIGGGGGSATDTIGTGGGITLPVPDILTPERLQEALDRLGDKVRTQARDITDAIARTIVKTCVAAAAASQLFPVDGLGPCEGGENVYLPGSDIPGVRDHISSNISTRPTNIQLNRKLTRWPPGFKDRAKRNGGDCSFRPSSWPCDEYPFATAQQGGEANYIANIVTLRSIDPVKNTKEGSLLGPFFYGGCNVRTEGQRFFVVPIVRAPTSRICG